MKSFELANGVKMPAIQLGTFRARGEPVRLAVCAALGMGYRAIDTAAVYRNHKDIQMALNDVLTDLNLTRKDIFLTSKLSPRNHGKDECRQAVLQAMSELGTDYLDLFLIHWPGVQGLDVGDAKNREYRDGSWAALEDLYKEGKLRAIGVSNYTVTHLKQLLVTCSVVPHVNQVEIHPHYPQEELVSFCQESGIHIQAYSSLGQSGTSSPLFASPAVLAAADQLGKSPAQILLKWGLQHGFTILPKSTNLDHIKENFDLEDFTITSDLMEGLNKAYINERCQKYAWDPSSVV